VLVFSTDKSRFEMAVPTMDRALVTAIFLHRQKQGQ
jgi:hypothetical protein